jgi:hypothetical protein
MKICEETNLERPARILSNQDEFFTPPLFFTTKLMKLRFYSFVFPFSSNDLYYNFNKRYFVPSKKSSTILILEKGAGDG